jgi:hypothetical protein
MPPSGSAKNHAHDVKQISARNRFCHSGVRVDQIAPEKVARDLIIKRIDCCTPMVSG